MIKGKKSRADFFLHSFKFKFYLSYWKEGQKSVHTHKRLYGVKLRKRREWMLFKKKRWVLIPLFSISLFYSSWLCALLVLVLVRVSFFSPCLARKCSLHLIAHSNFSRWFVLLLFFPWRMVMWSSRSLGKKRRQQSNRKKNNVHFRFGIIFYFHSIDLRSLFVWQLSSCTVAYLCVSTPKQWISRVWVCECVFSIPLIIFLFISFFTTLPSFG